MKDDETQEQRKAREKQEYIDSLPKQTTAVIWKEGDFHPLFKISHEVMEAAVKKYKEMVDKGAGHVCFMNQTGLSNIVGAITDVKKTDKCVETKMEFFDNEISDFTCGS